MAQAGYTPISLYYSTTALAIPLNTDLVNGELAINITDGKLYYKDNGGTVQLLASKSGASGDVVGPASATDTAIARFNTTSGKLIQNSGVTIDGSNNMSGVAQLNATTVDATNIEVTNIKAKDGTAAGSIADSTGLVTLTNLTGTTADYTNLEVTNIKAKDGTSAASIADSTGVISLTSNPVFSGGTANGVLYLNASKSATTGSAFVFDGTNVGIGTSAPTTKLTISSNTVLPSAGAPAGTNLWMVGADSVANLILLDNFGSTSASIIGRRSGGTAASPTAIASGAALFSLGGRGYGTTGYSSGSRSVITFSTEEAWTDTAQGARITFNTTTNGTTTTSERMRIDNAGNVGIGTTSPSTYGKFAVNVGNVLSFSSDEYSNVLIATGTSADQNRGLNIQVGNPGSLSNSKGAQINIYGNTQDNPTTNGSAGSVAIYTSTDSAITSPNGNVIRFHTGSSGTERARFPSAGGFQCVNSISVGNATPTTSGAGITFPATQSASSDANTLDDYEQGTFTPTIEGTTAAGVGTYTVQVGKYTKIGNLVTAYFSCNWSAHTGTGNMQIAGLPFTSENTASLNPSQNLYANNLTITGQCFSIVLPNATTALLYSVNNGSGAALAIDTAATIQGVITYFSAN